jgi:hypothetical protein
MYILQGKLDTHNMYTSYEQSPYVAIFHANPIELDGCTALKKKCSWLRLSTRLSSPWDPPQFLSQHNHCSSALKPTICWRPDSIDLLSPYLQHVISTFNTCSWEPTHHSLTDIGGCYNLGGASFPHHSTCLNAPPSLRLTNQHSPIEPKRSNPNLVSGTPPLDFYHSLSSKHSND